MEVLQSRFFSVAARKLKTRGPGRSLIDSEVPKQRSSVGPLALGMLCSTGLRLPLPFEPASPTLVA